MYTKIADSTSSASNNWRSKRRTDKYTFLYLQAKQTQTCGKPTVQPDQNSNELNPRLVSTHTDFMCGGLMNQTPTGNRRNNALFLNKKTVQPVWSRHALMLQRTNSTYGDTDFMRSGLIHQTKQSIHQTNQLIHQTPTDTRRNNALFLNKKTVQQVWSRHAVTLQRTNSTHGDTDFMRSGLIHQTKQSIHQTNQSIHQTPTDTRRHNALFLNKKTVQPVWSRHAVTLQRTNLTHGYTDFMRSGLIHQTNHLIHQTNHLIHQTSTNISINTNLSPNPPPATKTGRTGWGGI